MNGKLSIPDKMVNCLKLGQIRLGYHKSIGSNFLKKCFLLEPEESENNNSL